ncbi:hypothetical protein ACFWMU_24880 [Streptomyces sp. NPDC058357]|uniref:hypothetical protein n=1 Tax=unclassified Streptomyces TaxID=2593676 RepID=UPI003662DED1
MPNNDSMLGELAPATLERVLRARAESWQHNGEMEKAAELAAKGAQLSPSARMALGYYSDGKKAATAAGRDVSDPAASTEGADKLAAAYSAIATPPAN